MSYLDGLVDRFWRYKKEAVGSDGPLFEEQERRREMRMAIRLESRIYD
jgi:hypothetical protein